MGGGEERGKGEGGGRKKSNCEGELRNAVGKGKKMEKGVEGVGDGIAAGGGKEIM